MLIFIIYDIIQIYIILYFNYKKKFYRDTLINIFKR